MKRFLVQVIIFFAIIFAIDLVVGKACSYLVNHPKGGDNGRNNYICNEVNTDILVFGSSRAFHHYNPVIIRDSLGMSCYNCGQDGNGAILNYARYHLICQRYHPRIVVYDVIAGFDVLVDDNHRYLKWLKPYYDRKGIPDVFEAVDKTEKYKMMSQMYRYNSSFVQIASDFVNPLKDDENGFRPVDKEMDTMKIARNKEHRKEIMFDTIKIAYLNKMIKENKDTKFVFVYSPIWYGMDSVDKAELKPIMDICRRENIPFIDFSNDGKYVHKNKFFYDGAHMNARGADEFTRDLIEPLRRELGLDAN